MPQPRAQIPVLPTASWSQPMPSMPREQQRPPSGGSVPPPSYNQDISPLRGPYGGVVPPPLSANSRVRSQSGSIPLQDGPRRPAGFPNEFIPPPQYRTQSGPQAPVSRTPQPPVMPMENLASLEASQAQLDTMLAFGAISPDTYAAAMQELLITYSDPNAAMAYGLQSQVGVAHTMVFICFH